MVNSLSDEMGNLYNDVSRKRTERKTISGEIDTFLFGIKCSICDDMGIVTPDVPFDHPAFGKTIPCPNLQCEEGNKRRQMVWRKRLKSALVPEQYLDFTFETWQQLSQDEQYKKNLAYMACRLFSEDNDHMVSKSQIYDQLGYEYNKPDEIKNSLMLFGGVGMGKTGLVVATVNALLRNGETALYVRARDLVREIQKRYGKPDDGEMPSDSVLDTFQNAPVLVIDEFNMEKTEGDRKEIFESVMRHRYGHGLPTLMTANVNQQEFIEMWGERTADVTIAMAHWIPMSGLKLRRTSTEMEEL